MATLFIGLTSCSEDDNQPISLVDVDNYSINIIYPRTDAYTINVTGGDGRYSVNSNNDEVLIATLADGNILVINPLSTGEATITINDQSNQSYTLHVQASYPEYNYLVTKQDVTVRGELLTLSEVEEIKKDALASIPVQAEGGYRIVFTDTDLSEGEAYLYPDTWGTNGKKGTFERTKTSNEGITEYNYKVTIGGEDRYFVFLPYSGDLTKNSGDLQQPFLFQENLTEIYKEKYTHVEQVYTSQVLKLKTGIETKNNQ